MSLNILEIKKLIIISLFADDELFDKFVLKGGTALMIQGFNQRQSMDIDLSLASEFKDSELKQIENILFKNLKETFNRKNHDVIDLCLKKSPTNISGEKKKFWGGYRLEFKILQNEDVKKYNEKEISLDKLRQLALIVEGSTKKTFKVDISKFEYCDRKEEIEIDHFPIYIYTPLMIVYEKLRAICQQQDEYKELVQVKTTPRARDFYDIHSILDSVLHGEIIKEDILKKENLETLKHIFDMKKVPLSLLENIKQYREFHRDDFQSVEDTVNDRKNLESYDFYFNYVLKITNEILDSLISLDMMDNTVSTS